MPGAACLPLHVPGEPGARSGSKLPLARSSGKTSFFNLLGRSRQRREDLLERLELLFGHYADADSQVSSPSKLPATWTTGEEIRAATARELIDKVWGREV